MPAALMSAAAALNSRPGGKPRAPARPSGPGAGPAQPSQARVRQQQVLAAQAEQKKRRSPTGQDEDGGEDEEGKPKAPAMGGMSLMFMAKTPVQTKLRPCLLDARS